MLWSAFGCGAKMTALPVFRANMPLHIGVTTGLVTGVTAPTTPIGFATRIRPTSGFSAMMPRDFLPLRLFQIVRDLPLAFATLSSYTPRPVSSCPILASISALSKTNLPRSRTIASTFSCENVSKTAWAARALATSSEIGTVSGGSPSAGPSTRISSADLLAMSLLPSCRPDRRLDAAARVAFQPRAPIAAGPPDHDGQTRRRPPIGSGPALPRKAARSKALRETVPIVLLAWSCGVLRTLAQSASQAEYE